LSPAGSRFPPVVSGLSENDIGGASALAHGRPAKKYVAQAASVTRCDSVALIFESSEHADAIVQSEFGIFVPRQGDAQLPVEFCFMPKAAKEPALEVADFVANAVGGMALRMMEGRRDFGADFCSIFHDPPPNVVRYMHIDGVIPA
jgi:hypothetical protein